ncbi:hypothetical protein [Ligilactobacillus ceti]|uniref:Uncharacterized protein n=1 Tax=Ligilactobacillus ceti DSM 22408 TaxID=1122146 RepID=A0A0R2KH81_9LACO|nr:hypothetical protein [Ligilactobacillus ceti]KRN88703.1 hypothetical protein IV53_GL000670 [Ligilactobacillus ceti DSM 22408]
MNRYKEYKKVELPYLHEVPEHWTVRRISTIFELRKEKNKPIKTENILSLSAKYGVTLYSERIEKGGNKPKEDLTAYNICHEGDILLNCMNIVAGSVGISKYFGAISPVYYALKVRDDNVSSKYMEYLFRNYNFQRSLVGLGKGIQMSETDDGRLYTVRMRISWDSLKTQEFIVPPFKEQEQIANYLDWKISEINKLIKIEKEKITELKKAFNKKIQFNYNLFDSRLIKLKFLLKEKLKYGLNVSGNLTGEYRYIRITDIDKNGKLKDDNKLFVDIEDDNFVLQKGDVLFARSGATVGKTYIFNDSEKCSFAGYLIRARVSDKIIPKYLYDYTNTADYEEWKDSIFIKSTIQNISAEKYNDLLIPVIDLEKQKIVVANNQKVYEQYTDLIDLTNKKIEELKSLKQSLISEVVTGKIDVRNINIPIFEAVDIEEDIDLEELIEEEN